MLVSGAEGKYHLKLATSTTAVIAAELVMGQTATIRGQTGGIVWTYTSSGAAFHVGAGTELQIDAIAVAAASGIAFRLESGATLSGHPQLQSRGPISCSALAAGVGAGALDCTADAATGSITLAGPTFVSTSGSAMPLGSVKYIGSVLTEFTDALYTHEGGLYTMDVSADVRTATAITVESSMHVTVNGDSSKPTWAFVGTGSGFTVAAAASLTISSMSLDAGISVNGGGSLSLQSVGGSISGLVVADSIFSMDAASTASLGGTIRFENAGTVELTGKSIAAGSSLAVVGAGTAVSLEGCTVDAAVSRPVLHDFGKLHRIPVFFAASGSSLPVCLSFVLPAEIPPRPSVRQLPAGLRVALHLALALQRVSGAFQPCVLRCARSPLTRAAVPRRRSRRSRSRAAGRSRWPGSPCHLRRWPRQFTASAAPAAGLSLRL